MIIGRSLPSFVASSLSVFVLGVVALGCSGSTHASAQDAGPEPEPKDAGSVYLTSLSVTSASSSSVALVPAFSPAVFDYYVLCSAGTNDLTVSMTASTGAESALAQPMTSASKPKQTLSVSVTPNQAVVATATEGKTSVEYWVRCLPPDFPTMNVTAYPSAGTVTPGYYVLGNETPAYGGIGYAMVLDTNGVPVWYTPQPQTGDFYPTTGAFDVDSLSKNSVSFLTWRSVNSATPFQILDLASGTTTDVAGKGWALDSHELRLLPNGDYLMFTDQLETDDLTGYNLPLSDGGVEKFGPNQPMLSCDILEVDPSGNVVWKWIATDHLDPVKDNVLVGYSQGPDGPSVPDPFHCNSIEVDAAHGGNLLISARHMDSIFYIDRSTGKILWKMGGVNYTKDSETTFVPVADPFFCQHDARFMPGWSSDCGGTGQISMFDDHSYQPGPARGIVYDVNVGVGSGCPAASATNAWQYADTHYTALMGSFRILPDGSRTIGWGVSSTTDVLTEVDVAGNKLLDFTFAQETWSFRAIKVPMDQLDLSVMRKAVGAQ